MTLPRNEASESAANDIGVPERLETLFLENRDALKRFVTRALKPHEDAEDLLQDVFARVLRQGCRSPEKSFSTSYLYVTATNIIRDRRRHEWVQRKSGHELLRKDADLMHPPDPRPSAEAQIVWRDGVSIVKESLSHLKPAHAEIFILHWKEGLTMVEISKRTGIPVRSVERYASLALAHCKDALKRRDWQL